MLAHSLVFYLFSFITIASSLAVISARNTIHAVFFLILDFVSVSCLFIMMGAEYLGMLTLNSLCRCSCSIVLVCSYDA